jgi:hypothetical protein
MKKIFLALLFLFSIIPALAANDLSFTCTSTDCTNSSSLPLFSESNIYPGYTVTAKTTITNNRQSNCQLNFKLANKKTDDLLSSALTVSTVGDTTVWYAGKLSGLFDNQNHQLDNISSGTTKDFLWTVSFDQNSGNEYQNQSNLFDINFNFTCDDEPTPTNNPAPGAPACNDAIPNFSPTALTASPGTNSVTLNWTEPTGDFTYYLIAFGNTPGADTYGNPNIGGKGTHTYTIGSLSAATTYYFKIRVGNGCAPGPFTSIVSTTPGGVVYETPVVPTGFQAGVLGAETTESPSVLPSEKPSFIPYLLALILALLPALFLIRRFLLSGR